MVYIWFADYHAFIPSLLGKLFFKKVIIIIGGFDAARIPEMNYGVHTNPFRGKVSKICCRLADHIIPVSKFTGRNLIGNNPISILPKISIAYLGMAGTGFESTSKVRNQSVVSIIGVTDLNRFKIKGGEILINIARKMPETNFMLIGVSSKVASHYENLLPSNITLLPWVPNEQIPELLAEHKVICQFSFFEAFSLALLEGMLCGCIPVSHRLIGPAEFIPKNCGFLSPDLQEKNLEKALKQALASNPDLGTKARTYALSNLDLLKRETQLIKHLKN
ncbi:MAG: glycosyltransferase family 4 protein [Saprospiraceae bacterium]